jgi:ribonuclease BN (tRNA processing enzyme)
VKVTALGTADAFCAQGRGHTCWLLEDERGLCAVDFGATALQAMKRLGRDPQTLSAVHFTHLHGDHIAGWPFLLVDAAFRARRTAPLLASGPPGTRERLEALYANCYADGAARPLPFRLEVYELSPGQSLELAGRTVTAFPARHMRPPHVALCLRIGKVAFTGDTGAIPPGLCEGAQLLCAECTDLAPGPPRAGSDFPASAGRRHLSWEELREILPRLKVPLVLLAHLGDEARLARPQIEREAAALGLALRVCDDLDGVELPC